MFPPKARAILAGPTPRRVTVLHKLSDVDAYAIRHSDGSRAVVKSSQLLPREALSASHTTNEG